MATITITLTDTDEGTRVAGSVSFGLGGPDPDGTAQQMGVAMLEEIAGIKADDLVHEVCGHG